MFGKKSEEKNDIEFFTVYDSKARTYNEPFPSQNRETVLRDFTNAFRMPEAATKNRYYINAEDFAIYSCGGFKYQTGSLVGTQLEHVVNLHDLRAIAQPQPRVAQEMGISST